jgi:hypothetical protein
MKSQLVRCNLRDQNCILPKAGAGYPQSILGQPELKKIALCSKTISKLPGGV